MNDFVIAGVGGQGVVLAARILATAFVEAGFDVKQSEVHGMAQRGGSVQSHVRRGQKVHSPVISRGKADCVLGFEMLEALRASSYLSSDGLLVSSTETIVPAVPVPNAPGYPEEIEEDLLGSVGRVVLIDAVGIAREIGERRAANVVLVGALSNFMDISDAVWDKVIRGSVPEKVWEVNVQAFRQGKAAGLQDPSQGASPMKKKE